MPIMCLIHTKHWFHITLFFHTGNNAGTSKDCLEINTVDVLLNHVYYKFPIHCVTSSWIERIIFDSWLFPNGSFWGDISMHVHSE